MVEDMTRVAKDRSVRVSSSKVFGFDDVLGVVSPQHPLSIVSLVSTVSVTKNRAH